MLVTLKRSVILSCLVALLSLALASGNAHAVLHLDLAHTESCPEEHARHHGNIEPQHQHQHQHQHGKALACCCDCLGCTSAAYLTPKPSIAPAEYPARVRYDALTSLLSGRGVLPEPHPPRPVTLS